MSGSSGEKTELPTPKKVRDARQKGQVAKSQEVVTAVSLMAVIGYLWAAWGIITAKLIAMLDIAGQLVTGSPQTLDDAIYITAWETVIVMLPVVGITIFAAIAANYMQIGSVFALEGIMPKLDKISPGAGFKRIFSMKQVIELLKSVLKIVFLSTLLYLVVRDAIGPLVYSVECGMSCVSTLSGSLMGQTLAYTAVAFIVVALADFAYQRHAYTKSLMMTKDEVKREYKESEGDPHIKGKRKQLAQELVMSEGGKAARKGTAVVVNPTHLAIVLKYDPDTTPLPIVTAKGRNLQAHFLRTQAEEAGVPVFRNVPLARALYADTSVDEYIPDELFDAVAEVLAWVSRNEQRLYQGRLPHGVIDMEAGDHRQPGAARP